MQKVIVDTNVLVSALIQKNYPYLILYHCVLENLVKVCLSDELFEEYVEVLNRPKFSKYPEFQKNTTFFLTQFEQKAIRYIPIQKFEILNDIDDNKLLELAYISKADFLITGNTNHFSISNFYGTEIVNPQSYWENYRL